MIQALSIIQLHFHILTKGDRLLWLYLVWLGLVGLVVGLKARPMVQIPVFLLVNLYLMMIFNKDRSLYRTYFYDVLGIGLFSIHAAKLLILTGLLLPQLILLKISVGPYMNLELHLISLFEGLLINLVFYQIRSNTLKLFLFATTFFVLNLLIASIFSIL